MTDQTRFDPTTPTNDPEGDLVAGRALLLSKSPIGGGFDLDHLKAIHAFLFQDIPSHQPGETRRDSADWIKLRALESKDDPYNVFYAADQIEIRITTILPISEGPRPFAAFRHTKPPLS